MTIDNIIRQYDFNLLYAKNLVADLSEDQMTMVPSKGFENHAAWTIGHLVTGSAMIAEDLGAPFEIPGNWGDLFLRRGPGDPRKPDPDLSKYPSKDVLVQELEKQHNKVKKYLIKIEKTQLDKPLKWRFNDHMPTLLDVVVFMCVNHEAMHLGQLAGWRRALGMPSALAVI
ncbi:MAG: DinB family protein [Bacteroidetes bacterium]|nr:MAG: DinB family protein [Bacteroidota bacterium]